MGPLRSTTDEDTGWSVPGNTLAKNLVPFLGAGFSTSISYDYPTLSSFRPRIKAVINSMQAGQQAAGSQMETWDRLLNKQDIVDLLEWIETFGSRKDVTDALFCWPLRGGDPRSLLELADSAYWRRQWHPWMLLEDLKAWIDESAPYDLDALHPCSPAVIVARLLRERVFSRVVSTNWDALLELGATLTGMTVLEAGQDRPPRVPVGDRELLRVVETASEYLASDLGHSMLRVHKINGGVHSISEALQEKNEVEREKKLQRCFMVTTSDLHDWDQNRWARSLLEDALRSASVLMVGVSASDAVTYRLLQMRRAEQALHDVKAAPNIFAWSYSGRSVRLENALRSADGAVAMAHCAHQWGAWQLVYVWALIRGLIARIEPPRPSTKWIIKELEDMAQTLTKELQGNIATGATLRGHHLRPWLDLLVAAVPRWMTLSLMADRTPALVAEGAVNASLPTFYLPFLDVGRVTYAGSRERMRTRSLRALGSLLAALWQARDRLKLEVDSWTGLTTIYPSDPPHYFERGTGQEKAFHWIARWLARSLARAETHGERELGPFSFICLFPPRPLHQAKIKAAAGLLGDRRCRFRGGLTGGRVFICAVDPAYESTAPDEGDPMELLMYLGVYVPLLTLGYGQIREFGRRAASARGEV